jgi:hypothetical protein
MPVGYRDASAIAGPREFKGEFLAVQCCKGQQKEALASQGQPVGLTRAPTGVDLAAAYS